MYGATVGVAGSLKQLATGLAFGGDGEISMTGGRAAFSLYADEVEVVPLAGGAPVTFPGANPKFEPGVADPHLLFSKWPPPVVGVARGDGSGANFQPLPDVPDYYVMLLSWLGSTVIYVAGPSDQSLTIATITGAGTVSTELATGVSSYGWAANPAPTRVFYARAAGADGPPGLWTVDLPR